MARRMVVEIGARNGLLTFVEELPKRGTYRMGRFDCGGEKVAMLHNFVSGSCGSCGCIRGLKGVMLPDDPRHGTPNGYLNLGCRCQPCRDGKVRATLAAKQTLIARLEARLAKLRGDEERLRAYLAAAGVDVEEAA